MKNYLILFLFTFITNVVFANENNQKIIYQPDDIENLTNDSLKRENSCFNDSLRLKSFKGIIEIGSLFSLDDEGRFKFNIINSYQMNPYCLLGIGTGLRCSYANLGSFFEGYYYPKVILPVFVDLRLNFTEKKVSPYISINIGYSFNIHGSNRDKYGFFLNPTVGVNLKRSNHTRINFGLGYDMQRVTEFNSSQGGHIQNQYSTFTNAISVNMGISF